MRLAATSAAMTPSSTQLPLPAVPVRPGASAIGEGTSQAASAFALLLAGVMPMPTPAAATAALDTTEAPIDVGTRSPRAGLPHGGTLPAAGQNLAAPIPAGAPLPPASANLALDPPTPLASAPAVPNAGPTPGIAWSQALGQPPAAAGQPGPASDLSDGYRPARPPAPIALATPVAAVADDELAPRKPVGSQLAPAGAIDDPALEAAMRHPGHGRNAAVPPPASGDRPASPASGSSQPAHAPTAEPDPDRQPTPAAPLPGPGARGAAPKSWLTAAPVAHSPAPADARIEPPAEFSAAELGRTERGASEPSNLASRPPQPAPVVQLAIQIAGAAARRVERLVVQLEPAALGRVEVRLDFSHDNRVSALIAADRPETLELLQRDSRALERGLQDAGLRLDPDALSFALRQEQRGHERGAGPPGPWPRLEPATGTTDHADHADHALPAHWIGAHRVLDIRI